VDCDDRSTVYLFHHYWRILATLTFPFPKKIHLIPEKVVTNLDILGSIALWRVAKNELSKFLLKPYQQIPIAECGEPLVPIPLDRFAVESPHPYEKLGAPYGDRSPFFLRKGVLDRLLTAQTYLQQHHPGWRIQIFDAYRPVEVQQFMVDYSFHELVAAAGLSPTALTLEQRQTFQERVHQFWAVPSLDPATPPPHSTGAAIDVTLVDSENRAIDMGSPIDEISPRSHPDYFANSRDDRGKNYHACRQILATVMRSAHFQQHPSEWWHFSFGDQLWAWLSRGENPEAAILLPSRYAIARYGRV